MEYLFSSRPSDRPALALGLRHHLKVLPVLARLRALRSSLFGIHDFSSEGEYAGLATIIFGACSSPGSPAWAPARSESRLARRIRLS